MVEEKEVQPKWRVELMRLVQEVVEGAKGEKRRER